MQFPLDLKRLEGCSAGRQPGMSLQAQTRKRRILFQRVRQRVVIADAPEGRGSDIGCRAVRIRVFRERRIPSRRFLQRGDRRPAFNEPPMWRREADSHEDCAQATIRGMRRVLRSNQTAEAKQMAIGASRTMSQRQGNCSSRNSGTTFQTGSETGRSRNRTVGGIEPAGATICARRARRRESRQRRLRRRRPRAWRQQLLRPDAAACREKPKADRHDGRRASCFPPDNCWE